MISSRNFILDGKNVKFVLGIISFLALFSHAIPLLLEWKIVRGDSSKTSTIKSAMQSYEFKISLISSLSMAIPMVLELITRMIMNSKVDLAHKLIISNITVLIILVFPDLIVLLYCIPFLDIFVLGFILKARIIFVSWTSLSLIQEYNCQTYWSAKWSCIFHLLLCISQIPGDYLPYFDTSAIKIIETLMTVFEGCAVVISLMIILSLSY